MDIEDKKRKLQIAKERLAIKEKLLNEKEKRKRAKRLTEIMQLAFQSNITSLDNDTLLGAFLEISNEVNNPTKTEVWKEAALKFYEAQKNNDKQALIVAFKSDPPKKTKELMREMNFKWNSFRTEFYGFGNKEKIEKLIEHSDAKIEVRQLE